MSRDLSRLERVSGALPQPYGHLSDRAFIVAVWVWLLTASEDRQLWAYAKEHDLLLKWSIVPAPYPGDPANWPWRVRFDTEAEAERFVRAEFDRRYGLLRNMLPPDQQRGAAEPRGSLDGQLVRLIVARRSELRERFARVVGVSGGPERRVTTSKTRSARRVTKRGVRHRRPRASKRGRPPHGG